MTNWWVTALIIVGVLVVVAWVFHVPPFRGRNKG